MPETMYPGSWRRADPNCSWVTCHEGPAQPTNCELGVISGKRTISLRYWDASRTSMLNSRRDGLVPLQLKILVAEFSAWLEPELAGRQSRL